MDVSVSKLDFKILSYRDLTIFLIPLIIFSIYLYVYNPGILTFDSYNQMHQIATNQFNNWHPFFHTFIEMLCIRIYPSPASVAAFQILVFSTMWMVICKYHRNDNAENRSFVLQVILTAIICLIPLNAVFSITLWKDILFSYCVMFLCFLIKVVLDKKGDVDLKFILIMAFIMACVAQLRMNGLYVIILSVVILTIYFIRKYGYKKIYIALPALTAIFILLIACLNVAYEVKDHQKDFIYVKTSHMLADYDLHLNMSEEDREKLHKLIDEEDIKKNYDIYYSDPLEIAAHESVFNSSTKDYLNMALKYSLENPDRFLFYTFMSSQIVWKLTRVSDWNKPAYRIWEDGPRIEEAKEKFFEHIKATPQKGFENASSNNLGTWEFNTLNSFVYQARESIVLDTLLNSPALYMYMAVILLIAMHMITRSTELYMVYLPNLLNIIIVFGSIPAQNNGYLYPNFLVFYLLVIIFISIIQGSRGKSTH